VCCGFFKTGSFKPNLCKKQRFLSPTDRKTQLVKNPLEIVLGASLFLLDGFLVEQELTEQTEKEFSVCIECSFNKS